MRDREPRIAPFLLACLFASGIASAQQRAHVHGIGRLDVAVEGSAVEMQLEAPGDNLVGFEHAPRTAQERKTARVAELRLRQATTLFALPAAAGCTLRSTTVRIPGAEGTGGGHDHDDEHDEHHDEAHAEWTATYAFTCRAPAALASIDAGGLFRAFPDTRELRVQVIGPKGQTGRTLTPKSTRIPQR